MSTMQCLVIMPFKGTFDPVYQTVQATVASAVPGQPINCFWLKDIYAAGRITDDILDSIQKAVLCISDLTDSNANVMWETGYAMALGKPTVLISQHVETLPFDLKVHRVLPYQQNALDQFSPLLAKAVNQTLARYDVKVTTKVESRGQVATPVIAVTGSMRADPARVHRRVETLLRPYLSLQPLWYCGTNGIVDEAVLQYLMEHQQRVVAVGYHRLDFSDAVRQLVQANKLSFLDASVETIPRGLDGPTERDIFFASKADLVVLFWDGKSQGTGQIIEFFQRNMNNVLVGFV
jgi:hypothetical protein